MTDFAFEVANEVRPIVQWLHDNLFRHIPYNQKYDPFHQREGLLIDVIKEIPGGFQFGEDRYCVSITNIRQNQPSIVRKKQELYDTKLEIASTKRVPNNSDNPLTYTHRNKMTTTHQREKSVENMFRLLLAQETTGSAGIGIVNVDVNRKIEAEWTATSNSTHTHTDSRTTSDELVYTIPEHTELQLTTTNSRSKFKQVVISTGEIDFDISIRILNVIDPPWLLEGLDVARAVFAGRYGGNHWVERAFRQGMPHNPVILSDTKWDEMKLLTEISLELTLKTQNATDGIIDVTTKAIAE